MSTPASRPLSRTLTALAAGALILLSLGSPARAVIDNNATKQVWKFKYGVTDAQMADSNWLSQDSDGDGVTNDAEIGAGTNPFSAAKTIKVSSVTKIGATVELQFPTEAGKRYQAQSTTTLGNSASWAATGSPSPGTGATAALTVAYAANNFYRVRVDDIDTDGDGVADWAEIATSLNPAAVQTVPGVNDLAYVNEQIALPNVVTIKASKPFASKDGPDAGTLTVSRTQNLFPINVNYGVGGTAVPVENYAALAGMTSLARGVNSADIFVNPMTFPAITGSRSVTLTLSAPSAADAQYTIGAGASATVIINDSTVASGTGLLARYYDTASATATDAANFGQAGMYAFTRGTPTTSGTIVLTYTGPTIPGVVVGNQVKLSFTSGSLNSANYNNTLWTVTAVTASTITVSITGVPAFGATTYNGSCVFNIQNFPHPATITRVDPTVNSDWGYGTPNGVVIAPLNSPENFSATWETYLNATVAGDYVFQLDADDKAEVLLDTGSGLVQILEHNWNTPGADAVGTFKQSAPITLATQRYRMFVRFVDASGDARCRLQWKVPGTTAFANIPQANQFTQTQAMTYNYTNSGAVVVTPTGGHSFSAGNTVPLSFSTNTLFSPGAASSYSGTYTISAASGTSTVPIPNAVTSAGNSTITVPSTAGLVIGMAVTGTGLPANEFITAIGAGTITVTTGTSVTAQANTTLTATSTFTVGVTPNPIAISGAATTALSPVVRVPSTDGLAVGMAVSGTGLPASELITSIGIGMITVTTGTGVTTQPITTLTATLPSSGTNTGSGFVLNVPTSATTGVYNLCYANTTSVTGGPTISPGRVGIDAAITTANNGIWGSGTPDVNAIQPDTFSARWSGQVQPQFSQDYTFVVHADDSCALSINGQAQILKTVPSLVTGTATYVYDSTSGNLTVTYTGLPVVQDSFVAGENVRLDPTSGDLFHSPTTAPTYTYNGTTAIVDYSNLSTGATGAKRLASSFTVGETVELDPTSGGVTSLANLPYVVAASPAPTATTFAVPLSPTLLISSISSGNNCVVTTTTNHGLSIGSTVAIASVTGGTFSPSINGAYTVLSVVSSTAFTIASNCTVPPAAGTGTLAPTLPGNITIADTRNAVVLASPAPTATTFTVNIGPGKYANGSTGNISVDIANKGIKDWSTNGANERFARIPMIAGVRYDIQLDYFENTGTAKCLLSWYSPSQPKQIIPPERLYPSNVVQAPPSNVAPTVATALVGGPFTYQLAGSNAGAVTISGNPAWLTYSGGVLSGTPPPGTAGDYQIVITITNAAGTGTSVLNLRVDANAGTVVRELWTGVSGTAVASIPTGTTANGTPTNLTSLEAPTDAGDNYGVRIRGYVTAPVAGNYYFWIAANNEAELWISNDAEPVNAFKRAWVSTGSGTPQDWNAETTRKTAWLALEEGKKYYFEILHKAGSSGDGVDNLAVGWLKPGESGTTPSQVVPGYALSPYVAPAPGSSTGTLYVASMLAQAPAISNGVGSSTLRVSEDGNTAYMKFAHSGVVKTTAPTNSITSKHIHSDPYRAQPSAIIYDIDTPVTLGDGLITNPSDPNFGAYKWTILPVAGLSKADILEIIREGKSYINLHTTSYPNGEIRGNYTLADGTRTFTAPPSPPPWSDDSTTNDGAARFLAQATFGANIADITALKTIPLGSSPTRYHAWIEAQFNETATELLPEVRAREIADVFGAFDVKVAFNSWWKTSISGQDQLRQRIAFALSEIHVVSGQGPLEDNSRALAYFYDTLAANAFGNFRDILVGTTLTPSMGRYLDMLRNDKPDQSIGRIPNENYAREIKQLFAIGLYRMWPDGTLMLTSDESPIDTYTQREIVGLAHVFTGWDYGYDGDYKTTFSATTDWTRPMREVPARHFTGPKRVLNNEVLPGLPALGGQPLDAYATHLNVQISDGAYKALPSQELNAVHDMLFNHPNTGPFICRQLIQRLVTSHPSRDYLYRVVQKFNDDGSPQHVRGDMKAVIKAILLDYTARSPDMYVTDPSPGGNQAKPTYGKQREPIVRVANAARAFRPTGVAGTYSQAGTNLITINTGTSNPKVVAGNSVFLEFTDTTGDPAKPAPSTGTYAVVSATTASPYSYTIAAPGLMTGTYSQTAGSSVMTVTMSGHWLPGTNASQPALPSANWGQAYFDFTSGTANNLAGFDNSVRTVTTSTSFDTASGVGNISGTTFTITAPDTTARSGNLMISRLPASFASTGRNGVITIDTFYGGAGTFGTMADHGLNVGDSVFLNFGRSRDTTSGNPTSTENDIVYTITSVPDPNTFTVTARDAANAAMGSDNNAFVFPFKAQPLTRNGTVASRQGTFTLDNTDSDLQQTPLNPSTVFNYFLPDYKYAGTLASQGITTPEFQLTSETTVIRQANFLYNGIFNPANTNGISSFKAGTNALVLDFTPWMGATAANLGLGVPSSTTVPWTHNQNLGTLIDQLGTLLAGGQLSNNAKSVIKNFVAMPITSISPGSPNTNPCIVTTTGNHNLNTGDTVLISGMLTSGTFSPSNPFTTTATTRTITKTSATTFTVTGVTCTVAPSAASLANAHVSVIGYDQGTTAPSDTNKRDRLRAIIHLILTSPDFTIQR